MRFFTTTECVQWCEALKIPLEGNEQKHPVREFPRLYRLRCKVPSSFTQLLWFSRCIEHALWPRQTCLLWVSGWNFFPNDENWQLYYRFRATYGDPRLLSEAPGHLCLDFERDDLATLIQLGIQFGWDSHLISSGGNGRAFVCHDEWTEIGFENRAELDVTWHEFVQAELECSVREPE
ncbi:MAG: hypothetical protein JO317_02795 [Verrucomicrobiae bacterium]|nr:hypothetical protein [Verrucomicrobiae bacterium]